MGDIDRLAEQLVGLFKDSLQSVYDKLVPTDRERLIEYCANLSQCSIDRAATADPVVREKLDQEISGYKGALQLMADRYLLIASHEAEKAALNAFKAAVDWLVKIIATAVTTAHDREVATHPQ